MSTIQDGPAAGQTVPHLHIHVLPRRFGDFEPNDKVYDAVDASSKDDAQQRYGDTDPASTCPVHVCRSAARHRAPVAIFVCQAVVI